MGIMKMKSRSVLWLLWPYLIKYKKLFISGFASVVLTSGFMVAVPRIMGNAVDSLRLNVTMQGLISYAGAILGVTILSGLFRYFMRQTLIVASRKIEYDFRNDFFAHLLTLDRPYFDKIPIGDIMARATNDLDSVRNMIGPGIMNFASTFATLTMALILMIIINPKLTILSMINMPIITFLVFYLGREVNKRYTKIQEKYSDITAKSQENFSGIRVVKAYVQEEAEIKEFSKLNIEYINEYMSMVKIWGMFWPAVVLFSGMAIVIVLWFGGKAVIAGTLTLGEFVAFSSYLLMLIWPMAALGWAVGLYQRGKASLVRIKEILDEKPVIINKPDSISKKINGKIELRNLTFSYDSKPVLKGIDVVIEPGMNVAIIGSTGSGKSTLISLLIRAYPVEPGTIFIDNVDINNIDLESIRSQIVPVMQETFLFSETIRSNIAFSNYEQNMEAVMNSALAAGLAGEINDFPQKYDTILGERGITLSGGQKQRAALARALAADPRVLILDDAFSSVDTYTEEEILTNLRQILKGRTSIMISHRISTVKNADLILVLADGKIIERGRHNELLSHGGHYAELYEKQLLKDELEAI
jgi:ATP-binding cassette, subfamily B, multidrug efflux pump